MLPSGRVALVFNNWNGLQRWPLTIAVSDDGGATFPWVRDLLPDGGGASTGTDPKTSDGQEYSYPSIVVAPGSPVVRVSWTWRRQSVRYVEITENWIYGPGGSLGQYRGFPVVGHRRLGR